MTRLHLTTTYHYITSPGRNATMRDLDLPIHDVTLTYWTIPLRYATPLTSDHDILPTHYRISQRSTSPRLYDSIHYRHITPSRDTILHQHCTTLRSVIPSRDPTSRNKAITTPDHTRPNRTTPWHHLTTPNSTTTVHYLTLPTHCHTLLSHARPCVALLFPNITIPLLLDIWLFRVT